MWENICQSSEKEVLPRIDKETKKIKILKE